MGDFYKTCDIHGKPFPHNQIDTRKTDMVKVYVEKKETIEQKSVNLSLFVDKNAENEGIDVCANCMQEKLFNLLTETDNAPVYKGITWHSETVNKKDGTGTYQKNIKTVMSQDEIAQKIIEEKKALAPTPAQR